MLDHLVRAVRRYRQDGGDRLAAALTMYAIFALLPLLLVALSVLGFVLANDPGKQHEILRAVSSALPGVGTQLADMLTQVRSARAATGAFGLAGLLLSGLGGVDALRDALRIMWHEDLGAGNLLRKKLRDLLTVACLGAVLLLSLAVSAVAGALNVGPLQHLVSFGVGVAIDTALLLVLFRLLPQASWPWRRLLRGAAFGGVALGLLQVAGAWYVSRTAARSTALYGSIGTAIAVLVGLYLVSRVVLFAAAWTVTDAWQNRRHDPRRRWHRLPRPFDRLRPAPGRPRGPGAHAPPRPEPVRR